jgi:hypothetical protein
MEARIAIASALLVGLVVPLSPSAVSYAQGGSGIQDLAKRIHARGLPDPSGVVLLGPAPRVSLAPGPPLTQGPDVRVTTDPGAQNETTITHDPNALATLVGGANDYRNGDAQCGYYLSTSDGATGSWGTQGTLLPTNPTGNFGAAGDPAVDYDGSGHVYYSCLAFNRTTASNGIYVYKGTVSGGALNWGGPTEVIFSPDGSVFNDKDYIAADKSSGRVYVSWTQYNALGAQIFVAGSADGGATFNAPSPQVISDPTHNSNQGTVPGVASNGTLYVAWANYNVPRILLDKSTDHGSTWGSDQVVANITPIPSPLPNVSFRVNSFPTLGVDPSDHRGRTLYVAWADYRSGNADILFCRSTDGGTTWLGQGTLACNTQPLVITTGGCNSCDQFFPWISVDGSGAINLVFYSRINTTDAKLDVYLARSVNGGRGFSTTKVTDTPTDGGGFVGDYIGVTTDNGAVHPLWTAVFLDNGTTPNQDLYTDKVCVGPGC